MGRSIDRSVYPWTYPLVPAPRSLTSCHNIVAFFTRKYIRAVVSCKRVDSLAAKDRVSFLAAHQSVITGLAVKSVLAGLAQNDVITVAAVNLKAEKRRRRKKRESRILIHVLID